MESDLLRRSAQRSAWLSNATAQGVSYATSARAMRSATATATASATTTSVHRSPSPKRFASHSPFAFAHPKPRSAPSKHHRSSTATTNSSHPTHASASAGGGSDIKEVEARYFEAHRSQHMRGDWKAQSEVLTEIAQFEHKLKHQITALNRFYADQVPHLLFLSLKEN